MLRLLFLVEKVGSSAAEQQTTGSAAAPADTKAIPGVACGARFVIPLEAAPKRTSWIVVVTAEKDPAPS